MDQMSIQEILPLVEQPSRYLGSETNGIRKDPGRVRLRFALAFPDLYEIGMSHFGMQILYHILNSREDVAAERVFAPAGDMAQRLRDNNLELFSLETHSPLKSFDIIGFSLLYELGYTNVLDMLELAAIPLTSTQRDASHPLIIAGGPCTCNPEPVAEFFDAMVVGDGETVVAELCDAWMAWRETGQSRQQLLERWAAIEGVYIPEFFEAQTDDSGRQILIPRLARQSRVRRAVLPDLDRAPFPGAPVVPYGRPVHDRLRLEITRGCTRGCRFCQAGIIYRPVRERSLQTLKRLVAESLDSTGYEDISLLSLSTGDYGCILPLMEALLGDGAGDQLAVSLPSLRADSLTPRMMRLIKGVRKTGFTIAAEAGSQRLRNVINKNITREDIFTTVQNAFDLGWQVIKLYFMVGLPTETDEDIDAIVSLVRDLKKSLRERARGRRGKINVSVATFIPKPHTPFQWCAQISLAESRRKIEYLKSSLRIPGVHFKWQNPEVSFLEGLVARGDRRLSRLLQAARSLGCRFDGWSDQFRFDLWQQALESTGIDAEGYLHREMQEKTPLPWDHIDALVSRDFLWQEWQKALQEADTPDCREGTCLNCGACDFNSIQPRLAACVQSGDARPESGEKKRPATYKTVEVVYEKKGPARFFGHLEMVNIFFRALKRSRIVMERTHGFHPKPKVAFSDPLPIGMESLRERFVLHLAPPATPHILKERLNTTLPEGLKVIECREIPSVRRRLHEKGAVYQVRAAAEIFDGRKIVEFEHKSSLEITRTRRRGKVKRLDLKKHVAQLKKIDADSLRLELVPYKDATVRPAEVIGSVFELTEEEIRKLIITKL
jgi:radical SAM family uncharacterized protein/radical SAM-linked protein